MTKDIDATHERMTKAKCPLHLDMMCRGKECAAFGVVAMTRTDAEAWEGAPCTPNYGCLMMRVPADLD